MTFRFSLFILALALFSFPAQAQVQKINTLAGNGVAGYGGDGFGAAGAALWNPEALALDTSNNVYIVDAQNFRIRKVNLAGIITTVAGTGIAGNSGNGSIATSADINAWGIAFDRKGNLYFSDPANSIIRKVNRNGIISKYAGGGPSATSQHFGYTGDGGKADTARFLTPLGLAVDDTGNLFVADAGNNVIRRIDTFGRISTYVGTGVAGFSGDGGMADAAMLDSPYAVVVDKYHNLYVNDYKNGVIRIVADTGTINTFAGVLGVQGFNADGIPAATAELNDARGLGVDTAGNLYIADAKNNIIRKVDRNTNLISTAVGNGSAGFMGDLGFVTGCNLFNPYGVVVDKYGSIYIADANNNRVRKTYFTTAVGTVPGAAELSVFPNPTTQQIAVSGVSAEDKVTAYDMAGKQVGAWVAGSGGSLTCDVAHLATGIYMLQVSGNNGIRKAIVKLVKE